MDERTWVILLRIVHILGGIFWTGSGLVLAWFLGPAQLAAGEPGRQLMNRMMIERKMAIYLVASMLLTLLSGFVLYGRMAALAGSAWTSSPMGMAFGVGGLAALVAGVLGIALGATAGRRMGVIDREIQQGSADEGLLRELAGLQRRTALVGRVSSVLLLFAAAAMAAARYL